MEKQRIGSKYRLFKRLLIVSLLLCGISESFSQVFNSKVSKTLSIVPLEGQNLYTKSEIKFEVLLPYAKPSKIQLKNLDLPDYVNLKTSRKSEYYENEGGTKIELWFSFDRKGTYNIKPLQVLYNTYTYNIKFETIEIEDNPENLYPRLVLTFSNGITLYSDETPEKIPVFEAEAGKKLNFTVNLQYGVQLIQFDWELPKDSIFSQTEKYEINEIKYREKKYSKDLIPIATFEWIALASKQIEIPKISVVATSYKGQKLECNFPGYKIAFVSGENGEQAVEEKNTFYDSAFDFSSQLNQAETKTLITREICQTIADLRAKERSSTFDYFVNSKKRVESEDFFGFESSVREFPVKLIYVFIGIFVIAVIFLLIFIKKQNVFMLVSNIMLIVVSLVFIFLCYSKRLQRYGICVGGTLQSVPEDNAASKSEISGGNRVFISEEAADWYYIEFGDTAGWIRKNRVIVIR